MGFACCSISAWTALEKCESAFNKLILAILFCTSTPHSPDKRGSPRLSNTGAMSLSSSNVIGVRLFDASSSNAESGDAAELSSIAMCTA